MPHRMNRRNFMAASAAAGAGIALPGRSAQAAAPAPSAQRFQDGVSPWPICLDTATIRPASLAEKVRIAAETGYDAIEPWDGELAEYEREGGNLEALGAEIRDRGMFVPSVIGLWSAIPATQQAWDENLEATRNRMRMAAAIGSEHVQVIPTREELDPQWAGARYRDLLEIGLNDFGINPALVFVSFLPSCRRMSQATAIAMEADHPKAKIIPDIFHMYITDSGFTGIRHLQGDFIAIYQYNDVPDTPEKAALEDKHRVFPGDGKLPLAEYLRDLEHTGFRGCVSLELYNPEYWERDLTEVAKEGLDKTLKTIAEAGV